MEYYAVSILSILAGAGMAIYFIALWYRWAKVKSWERTSGTITEVGYREGRLMMWPAPLTTYMPDITYAYSYKGIPYSGHHVSVRDKNLSSVDKKDMEKLIDAIGSEPNIYVNPADPAQAYLMNHLKWAHISYLLTYIISGLILAIVGALLLLV